MINNLTIREQPKCRLGAIIALALTLTAAFPAWAGRPLATEDAGVMGPGECEIESYAGRVRDHSNPGVSTLWAQLGCGIGRDTQLAVGAGAERSAGEQTRIAVLAGKTFLRELTDEQPGVAVAYALRGAQEPGDRFRHEASELNGVVSIPHSDWLLHANLGGQYSHTSKSYSAIWGLAVERPGAIGPVDLMAEVFGDNHTAPWVQVAARWTVIPKRFFLDTSWGVQSDSARAKQITGGLKFAF